MELGRATTDLLVGAGCRHTLVERAQASAKSVIVISDHQVRAALDKKIFADSPWLTIQAGEASKTVESAAKLWSRLAQLKADRDTLLVAVGGGVVGDLAGFVAATYMRGVSFFSVPTSLLAMVDASVGGKVGIDLPEGKNLAGSFYPAQVVAVDPELLSTLPGTEWASGMAEVIKHAILSGEGLWETVQSFSWEKAEQIEVLEHLVHSAVMLKVDVVQKDPYERTGQRATLNLGHTYGHALEWCSDYSVRHGEAVGLGLLAGLRLSRLLGILETDFEEELISCLKRWSLPCTLPEPEAEHWAWNRMTTALARDKKNRDGQWSFVLPRGLGSVKRVAGPDPELVRQAFETLKDE